MHILVAASSTTDPPSDPFIIALNIVMLATIGVIVLWVLWHVLSSVMGAVGTAVEVIGEHTVEPLTHKYDQRRWSQAAMKYQQWYHALVSPLHPIISEVLTDQIAIKAWGGTVAIPTRIGDVSRSAEQGWFWRTEIPARYAGTRSPTTLTVWPTLRPYMPPPAGSALTQRGEPAKFVGLRVVYSD